MGTQGDDYEIKEKAPSNEALSSTAYRGHDLIDESYHNTNEARNNANRHQDERERQNTKVSGKLKTALFVFTCIVLAVIAGFIVCYAVYFIFISARAGLFGDEIGYAKEVFEIIMTLFIGGVFGAFVNKFLR